MFFYAYFVYRCSFPFAYIFFCWWLFISLYVLYTLYFFKWHAYWFCRFVRNIFNQIKFDWEGKRITKKIFFSVLMNETSFFVSVLYTMPFIVWKLAWIIYLNRKKVIIKLQKCIFNLVRIPFGKPFILNSFHFIRWNQFFLLANGNS